MNSLARAEVCAGVLVEVGVETEIVVLERVDALELVRTGVCRGRGRWWMSYACKMVNGCVIWRTSGIWTNSALHRVVQDFERLLDLVGELV